MSEGVDGPRGEPLRLEQHAELKSFLGLSLKNGLLNLVTLTLYRFWGKTEVRRRVWETTTTLNDEPFEYTGRGVELFLGFLFALVVVGIPFLLIVFGSQLLGPVVAAMIVLPFYILMGFLWGFGQFTAFRYMASRTAWRGIRFLLRGSASEYGLKYLGLAFLSSLTLGWYWPAARRRLAEPLWHGLRFGDRKVRFDLDEARKEKVYGAYALAWFGVLIGYFVLIGMIFAVLAPAMNREPGAPPIEPSLAQIGMIYLIAGMFAVLAALLFAPYEAAMLRSIARGISFDGVKLRLRVKWLDVVWLVLGNVLLATLSLGFLMPLVQARTAKFLINRVETEGLADLSTVRQAADAGPKTGEGLADAFGISPI